MTFTVLLSAVPGIEAMWTSVYLICSQNSYLIPLAVIINFISVSIFTKLLDASKIPKTVSNYLENKLNKKMKKIENLSNKYGSYAILILIGLPLSGIGSFSGAFIAKVLGINGGKLYIVIFLGIIMSLAPAFLISHGISILGIKC